MISFGKLTISLLFASGRNAALSGLNEAKASGLAEGFCISLMAFAGEVLKGS